MSNEEENGSIVIDLAKHRERVAREEDAKHWHFNVDPDDLALTVRIGNEPVLFFEAGSAERVARQLLRIAADIRNTEYRKEIDEKHLPKLRALINTAVVAARGGTRDEVTEEQATRLRYEHSLAWSLLTQRERGRFLRLMQKRNKEARAAFEAEQARR